jgi:hypothetical protein
VLEKTNAVGRVGAMVSVVAGVVAPVLLTPDWATGRWGAGAPRSSMMPTAVLAQPLATIPPGRPCAEGFLAFGGY